MTAAIFCTKLWIYPNYLSGQRNKDFKKTKTNKGNTTYNDTELSGEHDGAKQNCAGSRCGYNSSSCAELSTSVPSPVASAIVSVGACSTNSSACFPSPASSIVTPESPG